MRCKLQSYKGVIIVLFSFEFNSIQAAFPSTSIHTYVHSLTCAKNGPFIVTPQDASEILGARRTRPMGSAASHSVRTRHAHCTGADLARFRIHGPCRCGVPTRRRSQNTTHLGRHFGSLSYCDGARGGQWTRTVLVETCGGGQRKQQTQ